MAQWIRPQTLNCVVPSSNMRILSRPAQKIDPTKLTAFTVNLSLESDEGTMNSHHVSNTENVVLFAVH